jgi:DNA-binding beta-propeller fold protein YncE
MAANVYGEILLLNFEKNTTSVIARTGGRPLSIVYDAVSQGIYVADAARGLLWVDINTNDVKILVTAVDGIPLGTCNVRIIAFSRYVSLASDFGADFRVEY